MLASRIIEKVQNKIQDPSITDSEILALINEAQLSVAGGGERPHGLPLIAPLPDLISSDTVSFNAATRSVSLPAAYHRNVFFVMNSSGNRIDVSDDYIAFLRQYPKLTLNSVEKYCVRGNTIYYAPSATEDVTVNFFRKPVEILITESPDGFPEHFHERLFVSYCCRELFGDIEDGIEGRKVNTDYWENKYQEVLTDLERFLGPEDASPENVEGDSEYNINIF